MEPMIVPLVNVVLVLAAGIASIPWLRDAVEVSRTMVSEMPPNSNAEAEQVFLDLLREAETEIVMYDDGDIGEGSLYQSPKVVEAIKTKLQENPEFRVRCVLNEMHDTLFERELVTILGVEIRRRSSNPSRVHYKIIDGLKAYVSCHQPGEGGAESPNDRLHERAVSSPGPASIGATALLRGFRALCYGAPCRLTPPSTYRLARRRSCTSCSPSSEFIPGLTQPLGRLRAVAQPLDPAERLPGLARLRLAFLLGFRGLGRVERRPQDPQRHPVGIDRQRRVQVQAAGAAARSDSSRWSPAPASGCAG